MNTHPQVAVIGECMVELQKSGELYKQTFGGDTLNTALYLSRLTKDHGVTTRYITGLGKDPFSQQMLSSWQQEGINTDEVFISDKHLPGMYLIETSADGERRFFYWRDNAAAKFWLDAVCLDSNSKAHTQQVLNSQQFIYLSGISLAILPDASRQLLFEMLQQAKQHGAKIVFDNNYRPALWSSKQAAQQAYQQILTLTDIAFLTFDDEQLLYGDIHENDAIARTQQYGVNEIVIKRGAKACFVVIDNERIEVPANKISHVVDTTAAGDSFSAGYLACRILGGNPCEAAKSGHLLAGTVIQHRGAIIPSEAMPTTALVKC
ncbi:sugar kinase [Providencia rettgeri]|uniref:2-dehydro-3-deoxygluconokinase n=1 Tax=Providencia rettgeri TaxID=587 RepID=A0AAD2ZIV7_PRORE|nr:sugar kinase [Providencia rettgeri]ELR5072691.1 sugar kinase [Providencia stuartii]ELR5069846.1 sugar kinase [Providencia rettgeri]ELR5216153.1 sugar kinase [Providencia rettgeri]ELR5221179.1 sugar kinase [Providencia rettgeri]MDX7320435.1 sugar kinase [Providencia rettgeri]